MGLKCNKKIILWDFDGVILDSMHVRDLGFEIVLHSYTKDQVDELLAYHRANGGLSRYVKFRYFYEQILERQITEEQVNDLAGQFSEVMMRELGKKELLIKDSLDYINENYKSKKMYIVSGSDQKELRKLCDILEITNYFQGIYGSPTPKVQLVNNLLMCEDVKQEEAVIVGDSINDFNAAKANHIDFYGYNNEDLRLTGKSYIEKFADV